MLKNVPACSSIVPPAHPPPPPITAMHTGIPEGVVLTTDSPLPVTLNLNQTSVYIIVYRSGKVVFCGAEGR